MISGLRTDQHKLVIPNHSPEPMKLFFTELFEYGYDVNQKLLDVFNDNPGKTSEKSVKIVNHILNAHHIWNHRIEGLQPIFGVWELHDPAGLKAIDRENFQHTRKILDRLDLNQTVYYATSNGQEFSNSVRDVLFHIVNHSTYHRAQIATEFKRQGLEPLITDYIFYKRTK